MHHEITSEVFESSSTSSRRVVVGDGSSGNGSGN